MHLVDAAIIVAFLAYCIFSGLRARKVSSENLEEYFLAGRTLPGWLAGVSMAATQFAADTPLLVTGLIATGGIFALWRLWVYALAFLLMGLVLGPAWRRASVLTDAELAELRYGTRVGVVLRAAKALYFGTIFNCAVIAMVLFAATRIAEPFLLWDQWLPSGVFEPLRGVVESTGMVLTSDPHASTVLTTNNILSLFAVVAVTTMYSTTGGLRAVVATDLVQFAVAMIATFAFAIVIVHEVGGLGALTPKLEAIYGTDWTAQTLAFTPSRARDVSWVLLGTLGIQWIAQMNSDGTGYLAQRTMACRSDADAKRAAIVFTVAQVLLRSLLWIPIGLGLLILFPSEGGSGGIDVALREGTYIRGINELLPTGIKGLMLVGMIAALASTLDTHLNWGASYWANDVYARLYCQLGLKRAAAGRELVWVARLANLLILILAIVLLTQLGSIQKAWQTTLLLGAGMGIPLLLRWFWWRVTAVAELGAIVVSTVLAPILLATVDGEGERMLLMTLATTTFAVGASLLGPQTPSLAVLEFYRRVRPPGFWGPAAARSGDDPRRGRRRLRDGLLATGASALALYCVLVGVGTWLFDSPPPVWLPSRVGWLSLLAVVAIGLSIWLARRRALGGDPPPGTPPEPPGVSAAPSSEPAAGTTATP